MGLKFWGKKKDKDIEAPKPGEIHKKLGTFEVIREIGRGAMGVVYLGKDEHSGRDVAIKTMTLASDFDVKAMEDAKERFMREARILTWLHHPDIVTIYDVGEEHGLAFIAMEFLTGAELTDYTERGRLLPVPKVLEIMARSADALGYAHEDGIVHRDVKPGNIMYGEADNSVKVTDFGISRLVNLKATRAGLVLGTPLYMSPEQVMGKQIDGISDLFSLGSTFFQLLSGELPFEGESEFEVMQRIVQQPQADLRALRSGLPSCVYDIVDRCLQKDPADRYQSGSEMAEAIRQCAAQIE